MPDKIAELKILGKELKPQYVNIFQIVVTPDVVRLVFGDAVIGTDGTMHTAIVLSHAHAKQLGDLIAKTVAENEQLTAAGKPGIVTH
jgi:hypothetical protein